MRSRCWKILILGSAHTGEMQPVAEAIAEIANGHELREASGVDDALELYGDGWFPDLTIACQQRPDEFSHRDVLRLLNTFPLSRLVCCYGFWCESDGRNRDVWPPAARIAARAAVPRIHRELDVLENRRPALPMTAGRDEVFAFDCPGELSPAIEGRTVGIVSLDRALRDWVDDLLTASGFQTRLNADAFADADAVVWDADPLGDEMQRRLRVFHKQQPATPVVALMNSAIEDDVVRLGEMGVGKVVSKLASHEILLDELFSQIASAGDEIARRTSSAG